MVEQPSIEYKELVDLDNAAHRLGLVKEIVAMANADGGEILVGYTDDGTVVGLDDAIAEKFDPARIGDLVGPFVAPDNLEVLVQVPGGTNARRCVRLVVPRVEAPPIVMARPGNYQDDSDSQKSVFRKGDVYIRRNTQARPAARQDYVEWRKDLENRVRNSILEKLTLVVESGTESIVRIIDADEVKDTPSFLLSQTTDLFVQNADRLLGSEDLIHLWLHRDSLTVSATAAELLLQSALRKRTTLFLWLGFINPTREQYVEYVDRLFEMNDRDKSDAGRALLSTAALYLDPEAYAELADRLARSRYAHFRQAAQTMPDMQSAVAILNEQRRDVLDDVQLNELTSDALLGMADEVIKSADGRARSRRIATIGLAYLDRRLQRRD